GLALHAARPVHLGLIFQIIEDLLDLTGDPLLMSKAAGVDIPRGKGVAAAIARKSANGKRDEALGVVTVEADPFLPLKERLVAGGAVEEGRQMAQALAVQAHATLDRLPQSEAVDALRTLITQVMERDH